MERERTLGLGAVFGRWMNDIYASSLLALGKDGERKQIKVYTRKNFDHDCFRWNFRSFFIIVFGSYQHSSIS